MGTRAAKGRKLFSLAAVCVLVAAVLAPAPASASRALPRATGPDLERLPALELAGAAGAGQAEPLPLYTFVDVVALDRVAGLDVDQVEAAVGRQRHRLHLVASELARPGALVWGSKTATGVSVNAGADKHLERSELGPKSLRPSFQGLWTDPVSGLSYARNRWYDARSASWLSEDPMGAVDSVNLYAFVGWGPQSATDPMGLMNDWNSTAEGKKLQARRQELANQARLQEKLERAMALTQLKQDALSYLRRFPAETVEDKSYKRQLLAGYLREQGIAKTTQDVAALVEFVLGPMGQCPKDDFVFSALEPLIGTADVVEGISQFVVEVSLSAGAIELASPLARVAESYLARSTIAVAIRSRVLSILERRTAALADDAFAFQKGSVRLDVLLPGTGSSYDKLAGQGIYVLMDDGSILYVGRGDAPVRVARHAASAAKGHLTARIIWENSLPKAQAKGLEQALIDYFGGAQSANSGTSLLNKIRAVGLSNPNASAYEAAVSQELFEETLRRIEAGG